MCFGQKKAPFAKLKNEEENGDDGLKKKSLAFQMMSLESPNLEWTTP